jgi:hypothetical protein
MASRKSQKRGDGLSEALEGEERKEDGEDAKKTLQKIKGRGSQEAKTVQDASSIQ